MELLIRLGERVGSQHHQENIDGDTNEHPLERHTQGGPELLVLHHIAVGIQRKANGIKGDVAGNRLGTVGKGQCNHMDDGQDAHNNQQAQEDAVDNVKGCDFFKS